MYAQKYIISLLVILSTASQCYSVRPKMVYLESEPIEFVTEYEDLRHLPRMKKEVDKILETEEKESKTKTDPENVEILDVLTKGSNNGAVASNDTPSNSSSSSDLGILTKEDQVFKNNENPNEDLTYQDKMDKADEETKKRDESLSKNESIDKDNKDEKPAEESKDTSNDKSDESSSVKPKENVHSIHHSLDHSTETPVTKSMPKIIAILHEGTQVVNSSNTREQKSLDLQSNGTDSSRTHSSSIASVHQPTIFNLFTCLAIIWFIF